MIYCQQTIQNNSGAFLFPAIITGSVAVLLFIIGRLVDSKIKLKEQRKSWYLKVILEPNIDKIESFFNCSIDSFEKSVVLLTKSKNLIHKDYITKKAQEFKKFNDLKRSFEYNFISLVGINNSNLQFNLTQLIIKLEDIYKAKLDVDDLSNNSDICLSFRNNANEIRTELYKEIYQPLEYHREKAFTIIVNFFKKFF